MSFQLPQSIETITNRVCGQLTKQKVPNKYAFNWTLIFLIGSILLEVAKCLVKQKKDTQEMFETIQKPNPLEKIALKRAVRKEFEGTEYENYVGEIYTAILAEGSIMELDEATEALRVGASY